MHYCVVIPNNMTPKCLFHKRDVDALVWFTDPMGLEMMKNVNRLITLTVPTDKPKA